MASARFADSSALAKRYLAETGASWVRSELDPAAGTIAHVARITAAELVAAITRKERGGGLTAGDASAARASLRSHFAGEYQIVEVDEAIVDRAMLLAERHGLRG